VHDNCEKDTVEEFFSMAKSFDQINIGHYEVSSSADGKIVLKKIDFLQRISLDAREFYEKNALSQAMKSVRFVLERLTKT
jgi:hypothetical protein